MFFRRVVYAAVLAAAALSVLVGSAAGAAGKSRARPDDVAGDVKHDVSPPLAAIAPAPDQADGKEKKEKEPKKGFPIPDQSAIADPVVQSSPSTAATPALGAGFDGLGQGFTGPAGTMSVDSAPPDPNAAVGPNHVVEIVNESFAVFDKSGTVLYGPARTNTLWSGFGGGCQSNDDGDATVEYDKLAGRWIITQFSVRTTPYLECVAISTSSDPTGSYYRYAFQYSNFPDYPKLGVWSDAYYVTFNMFRNGQSFTGPEICAYDKAKMLAGQPATQQCFLLSTAYGGLLPADLDGSTPPPTGSPGYVLGFGTNSLLLWKLHVDWAAPANTTLTGPGTIPVAAFSPACGGGTCVPQAGTTQKLDTLADRLMYRLAYRNFGDHESLVVDHSVTAGTSVGVRWYELRNPGGTPAVYQQGTYAPDGNYRWMGSAAMDHAGNIGLGYSISGTGMSPGIRYTGRLAGDPLGLMTQGEGVMVNGGGSQLATLARWGDYSSLSVDPADDCTLWYTAEYLASSGTFNWHTRIASFTLPGCSTAPFDFSLAADPASVSVAQGQSGTATISTAVTSGSGQPISLSASGQPAGVTVSFNPASPNGGGSSTMTIAVGADVATGDYPITVTGTNGGTTHTTSVTLSVTPAPPSDFGLSLSPSSLSLVQGASGSSTVATTVTSGSAQSVSLSASGLPAGATASFSPASVTAGGSSTLTVSAGTAAPGTYSVTVTGAGPAATHSASLDLTVTAAPANAVQNGGFETGSLGGWTTGGVLLPGISTAAHTGSYSARLGSSSPYNGNSVLQQTVVVPVGSPVLTFWYQPHCPDTLTYDQIQLQIRNTAGTRLATVLNACSNSGAWTQVSYSMAAYAGQTVVLWLNVHDDNWPTDPTWALFDDVVLK